MHYQERSTCSGKSMVMWVKAKGQAALKMRAWFLLNSAQPAKRSTAATVDVEGGRQLRRGTLGGKKCPAKLHTAVADAIAQEARTHC